MTPTEKQWARQAYAFAVAASKSQTHMDWLKMLCEARELVANCPDSLLQIDIAELMAPLPEALPGEGI